MLQGESHLCASLSVIQRIWQEEENTFLYKILLEQLIEKIIIYPNE